MRGPSVQTVFVAPPPFTVMAGLGSAIHAFVSLAQVLDGRHKAGHAGMGQREGRPT